MFNCLLSNQPITITLQPASAFAHGDATEATCYAVHQGRQDFFFPFLFASCPPLLLGAADKSVVVLGSTRVNSHLAAKPPQFVTSSQKSLKVFVACERCE